jgi:exosortase family protein XrtF
MPVPSQHLARQPPHYPLLLLIYFDMSSALRSFLLRVITLLLVWHLGYTLWLKPQGVLDHAMSGQLARASVGLLNGLGIDAQVEQHRLVCIQKQPAVWVGDPCNGVVLFALFTGFIIAFPGPGLRKLWFIPLGCGLIYLLNILRVGLLAVLQHWGPAGSVDFNHHYTFTFVVYGVIGALWVCWVKRTDPSAYVPTFT